MTNEKIKEAIECLKAVHEAYDVMCGDWSFCWTAIEALEKQIPKKPIEEQNLMTCAVCGCREIQYVDWCGIRQMNYCPCCGQAIDWSGNND